MNNFLLSQLQISSKKLYIIPYYVVILLCDTDFPPSSIFTE